MKINLFSQRGGFLIGALVFVVILGIVIFSVATLVTNQSRSQAQVANERKAFYAAETGIEYALGVLNDSLDWRGGVSKDSIGDGEFSIKVDDKNTISTLGDTILVTATGYKGKIQRSIQVYLMQFGGPDIDYALLSGGDIDFTGGKAVINGDLHSNGTVKMGVKDTVNGTITQAPPVIDLPEVDWNFFKKEAMDAGQYVEGDKDFVYGVSYTGVWYITGKAKVKDNGVVINGTLVSEGDVELIKNDEKITATPEYYPAILTKGDIVATKNTGEINGLIYCNNLNIEKNLMTINGAIITTGTIKNSKNETEINFEPKYLTGLAGIDFKETGNKGDSLLVLRWQNKKF